MRLLSFNEHLERNRYLTHWLRTDRLARRSSQWSSQTKADDVRGGVHESAVGVGLAAAVAGSTALTVAHRLSRATSADRIVVIDDGRIVEQGTRDELVATRGGDAVSGTPRRFTVDVPSPVVISTERMGGAPISWGVCEVPGWGVMLSADRVLSEMSSLGITATELGAPGFLPRSPELLAAALDRHGMAFIGGFVPVVLHDRDARDATLAEARDTAALFAAAGGTMFVSAVVVDAGWGERVELSAAQWDHLVGMLGELDAVCAEHGLTHALHPHVGTLVETPTDVATVLERSDVAWCLDTGHLLIGGYDPVAFADDAGDRVRHVHLKDVHQSIAADVRAGRRSLRAATGDGLFCPLGTGDAPIETTVDKLESIGYRGWYVLEQDTDLGSDEPEAGTGPIEDVRASVRYLRSITARAT